MFCCGVHVYIYMHICILYTLQRICDFYRVVQTPEKLWAIRLLMQLMDTWGELPRWRPPPFRLKSFEWHAAEPPCQTEEPLKHFGRPLFVTSNATI